MEQFETVYREHSRAVFRYAVKCVGRQDVAEDLAADAFMRLAAITRPGQPLTPTGG